MDGCWRQAGRYERPAVSDYGTLVELTADSAVLSHMGIGTMAGSGSVPLTPLPDADLLGEEQAGGGDPLGGGEGGQTLGAGAGGGGSGGGGSGGGGDGSLPFTGLGIAAMGAVGAGISGAGMALRRQLRRLGRHG